jgi:hypothetical protein
VAVFGKRERAGPATSADYEQRDLPAPEARSVLAKVEGVGSFGPRCGAEAQRLGMVVVGLTVLGDGAGCLEPDDRGVRRGGSGAGRLPRRRTPGLGGPAGVRRWAGASRLAGRAAGVVGDDYLGVVEALARLRLDEAAEALNYFCEHQGRLGYAARLARGQVIGSVLVEGTIKQRVNVRMKRTGACWRPEHVGPFAELTAMADTPEWGEY